MFLQKRIGSAAPFCIVIVLLQQEITTKAFTSVTQDHFYSTNATRQTRQISYFIICKGATFHHFDMKQQMTLKSVCNSADGRYWHNVLLQLE